MAPDQSVNALALDHWGGRPIDDVAAECDEILIWPPPTGTRRFACSSAETLGLDPA